MPLKLNNISKKFGDKVIFENFSYSFEEKGLYLITGKSGIGKTTLLRIVTGLDTQYNGDVENGGINNISFMFQEYRLFPTLTAVKNVSLSKKESYDKSIALLTRLGFQNEDLKKKPHHLSGGMKQRVAFARAVMMDAPILILDEPTKELDTDTAGIVSKIIAEEAEKRLVIVVTHDSVLLNTPSKDTIKI